jgi:large subunit ribosomal protein L31
MREGIHPTYPAAKVNCACGSVFVTKSTRGDFSVDVCSACHPFYTGTQKLIDTAGRVDRFQKRYAATKKPAPAPEKPPTPKSVKAAKPEKAAAAPATPDNAEAVADKAEA